MTRKAKTVTARPKAIANKAVRARARAKALLIVVHPENPAALSLFKGAFAMTGPVSAEKIEAYLTMLNDKAKMALDKSTKLGTELTELAKGNLEAAAESTKIAAKAAEAFAQTGAASAQKGYETATATAKRYASVKTPAELMQLNSEIAKASFDTAMTQAFKMTEVFTKLSTDFLQPLSGRYAVAAEKLKSAAF